uniref:DWNN domain-containing protein n=1 Tax=Steinernema glaseri TaxID=37863 RepID=A0A1I7YP44_9BILA
MSSVHYKFRSSLESKTHTFDGLHISVAELKKAIYSKEGLREESFELVLSNAHTKRTYAEPNELIPRNSSVIVQRMPRENAAKNPKIQDTSTSGIIQSATGPGLFDGPQHIGKEEYEKMTEEERIQHMKNVSSFKYQPAN